MKTDFKTYLLKNGFQPRTATSYANNLKLYLIWCQQHNLNTETTSLNDLYDYKRHCVEKGLSVNTIRQRLSVIKHYFESINRTDNPALFIKHKKREKTLPKFILSNEDAREIYRLIDVKTFIGRRNKVMLGMVIFQGLKREDLSALEINHINLEQVSLYVPSTAITNSRSIELHPMQMKSLMSYLYEFRPKLLTEAKKETNKLFFSMGTSNSIDNALQINVNHLKRKFSSFKSLTQLRESRMSIWVKKYGIRKAQYLSGIRYASSMLRYKTTDIEKLKMKLKIVHPMEMLKLSKNVTN